MSVSSSPDLRLGLLGETRAEADPILRRLDSIKVVIRASASSARLALALANHVARICPNVELDGPTDELDLPVFGSGPLPKLGDELVRVVRVGQPRAVSTELVVDVGRSEPGATLYVSADSWSLRMSTEPHDPLVGIGPAVPAAAALSAAEIFRRVLPELPGVRLNGSFEWNLIDYATRISHVTPPSVQVNAVCFGAGSVGSSLVQALLLSDSHGQLEVVDDDRLERRNRLRYPAWVDEPAFIEKVAWLERVASGSRLRVIPFAGTCRDWQSSSEQAPAIAVSAVDSREARRQVADVLARETLNAGIEGLALHVSRHRFGDGQACVYCPYVDLGDQASELDVMQELTGLELPRVGQLLSGEKLTVEDIESMIATGRLSEADRQMAGGRIGDIARARLYAQARIGASDDPVEINAPFVPGLAGALLAAELLKPPRYALDRRVDVDCSGLPTGWTSRPRVDASGRCVCHSSIRVQAYRQMWPPDSAAVR